jgi:hypothetical protein
MIKAEKDVPKKTMEKELRQLTEGKRKVRVTI